MSASGIGGPHRWGVWYRTKTGRRVRTHSAIIPARWRSDIESHLLACYGDELIKAEFRRLWKDATKGRGADG